MGGALLLYQHYITCIYIYMYMYILYDDYMYIYIYIYIYIYYMLPPAEPAELFKILSKID